MTEKSTSVLIESQWINEQIITVIEYFCLMFPFCCLSKYYLHKNIFFALKTTHYILLKRYNYIKYNIIFCKDIYLYNVFFLFNFYFFSLKKYFLSFSCMSWHHHVWSTTESYRMKHMRLYFFYTIQCYIFFFAFSFVSRFSLQ